MKECPFCREQIQESALKCRYCQSVFYTVPQAEESSQNRVTYVVDKGLINYLKCATGILALIIAIAAFVFGFDLTQGKKDITSLGAELRTFADEQKETFQARQAEVQKNITELSDAVKGIDDLRARAETASRGSEDMQREMQLRFNNLARGTQGNMSEEKVRGLVEEILVASLSKLRTDTNASVSNVVQEAVKSSSDSPENRKALDKIMADASYAQRFLNETFSLNLPVPPIVLLDTTVRNAFWDGKAYHCPPQVEFLPDVTYHEMTYAFLSKRGRLEQRAEAGALFQSYADVLVILIKQKRGGIADEEKWLIAPGGGAWVAGQDIPNTKPRIPLRSIKEPGNAYRNHPLLGNDPQPNHMRALYRGKEDSGGVHLNSGIPSKVFFEAASRIGIEKAKNIWYQALPKLEPSSTFVQAALVMTETARSVHGQNSEEETALKNAWQMVGALGFVWSKSSSIYHFPECRMTETIRPALLETALAPPPSRSLHVGCPSLSAAMSISQKALAE